MNVIAFVQIPRPIAEILAQRCHTSTGIVHAIACKMVAIGLAAYQAIPLNRAPPTSHDAWGFERVSETSRPLARAHLHR